jgi:hypothetical protein
MTQYWRPEPKRRSFAWWALLVPAVVYSAGVIVYAHAAFSPADIATNGHWWGSMLMVIGGEAGTLATASEVFRKHMMTEVKESDGGETVISREANGWDWLGLVVSLVATLGNLFVVYAAISELRVEWIQFVRSYGPLALLLCSGLDFYANVMEFGFFNASFDQRWREWNDARHSWERRYANESVAGAGHEAQLSAADSQVAHAERTDDGGGAHTETQSDAESEHSCDYCGRTFATPQGVSAHLRYCDAYKNAEEGK